jgi:cytochrome c553
MPGLMRGAAPAAALLAALFSCGGCGERQDTATSFPTSTASPGPPGDAPAAPAPPPTETAEEPGAPPTIKAIMGKLTKGQGSLTPVIGEELHEDPVPWEALQGQTREYARLAAALVQNEPPKGSPESWAKQAGAFSETAAALDRAAQARDADAAREAHDALAASCMACHREHRVMGPGRGMPPGGPGPGGRPPGGGPPDGSQPR